MGKDIHITLKYEKVGSIGIGAMIVFIAMVLVAGIAASVFIQTSNTLEMQALSTGKDTTVEVSTGIAVYKIEGYAPTGSNISKLAIMIKPRAGSDYIDVSYIFMELSDTNKKIVLNYSTTWWLDPDGRDDIFSAPVFPDHGNLSLGDASQFGVLVIEDADNSITDASTVMINRGDKIYLGVNTTACFDNISRNQEIEGCIVPESGSPGIIKFTAPRTFNDNIIELQ